mgnify:CR=1 FL=1|tara:strand:+ start:461 stop:1300 length:840 start_codon:yes stop_codon:yes gene_type:complete
MSNDNQTVAQTPANNPTWEAAANPMIAEVGQFLQSRRKTFTCNFNLDVSTGVQMSKEPRTYTREQVIAFAVDVLNLCVERGDCKGMPTPSEMGASALGKYITARSTYNGVSKYISIKQLNSHRRVVRKERKAARLEQAQAEGKQWYADGVFTRVKVGNDWVDSDTPAMFPSRKKAVSAYLRKTVGDDWSKQSNKGELKDMALSHVRQGSLDAPTAQENRDAQSTGTPAPAPVAAQSTVSAKVKKADLVAQAVELGISKSVASKKTKADLVKLIAALNAL